MNKVNLEEFESLLDRHGADIEHWPPMVRQAARAFAENSAPARAAWAAMRTIEAVLRLPVPPDAAGAINAITANAVRHPQMKSYVNRRRALWSAAAAAALLLGLAVGAFAPPYEISPNRLMAASFSCGCADVD